MAGAASHAVDGINDRCSGDGRVLSAKTMNGLIGWERRQMSFCRRSNQGFGERQTSAAGRWLQDDVDILRSTEPMREMDVPGAFRETGHVVAVGAQLFRNGRMRNDDAWNCGSVIRPNENGRWASGISTIVDRYTKETNTDWMMRMVTGIKEADVCAMERAVRKQKLAIVGSTGHRAVIGVSK